MKDKIRSPRLLKPNGAWGRVGPSTSTNQRAKTARRKLQLSLSIAPKHSTRVILDRIFNDGNYELKREDKQFFYRRPSSSLSKSKSCFSRSQCAPSPGFAKPHGSLQTVVGKDIDPKAFHNLLTFQLA
jgi:hypothetical protein